MLTHMALALPACRSSSDSGCQERDLPMDWRPVRTSSSSLPPCATLCVWVASPVARAARRL